MSDTYNLDEQTEEYFEFRLEGNDYRMRFPTTEEALEAQKLKDADAQLDWIYGFISPVKDDGPNIRDVIAKVNLKKLQRFNQMVKTEFGVEGA